MTQIRGVFGAVDDVGVAYRNDIEDIRAALWDAYGQREGIIRGFDMTLDSGSLSVTFSSGAAVVQERGTDITADERGYHVFNDDDTVVAFDVPDAASRNDALVFAWADPQYGAMGAEVDAPGPQIVVVKGTSGSTTPRTDTEINTAIGPGGWFRYADVVIDNGDTEVNPANVTTNDTVLAPVAETDVQLIQAGAVVITVGASTDAADQVVVFDEAFAAAPTVVVSQSTGNPAFYFAAAINATASQFTARGEKAGTSGSSTVTVRWHAVGTRP